MSSRCWRWPSTSTPSICPPIARASRASSIDRNARSPVSSAVVDREFLFVLEDLAQKRIIGTSMIYAQHGTKRAPHIFFRVENDERYSVTLDRYIVHQTLRIGYNYNGPTEIGGLILLPEYRRNKDALGKALSYVRFLFMRMHRELFRDHVLSELLPPLEPDGTSKLWEALGRHFTGLTYQEADRLSKDNKEFIHALFPDDPIHTELLPEDVRAIIGQVGEETRGVEKMLRRIGFDYAEQIDPFDGGPHFIATTNDITIVRDAKEVDRARARDRRQALGDPRGRATGDTAGVPRDRHARDRARVGRRRVDRRCASPPRHRGRPEGMAELRLMLIALASCAASEAAPSPSAHRTSQPPKDGSPIRRSRRRRPRPRRVTSVTRARQRCVERSGSRGCYAIWSGSRRCRGTDRCGRGRADRGDDEELTGAKLHDRAEARRRRDRGTLALAFEKRRRTTASCARSSRRWARFARSRACGINASRRRARPAARHARSGEVKALVVIVLFAATASAGTSDARPTVGSRRDSKELADGAGALAHFGIRDAPGDDRSRRCRSRRRTRTRASRCSRRAIAMKVANDPAAVRAEIDTFHGAAQRAQLAGTRSSSKAGRRRPTTRKQVEATLAFHDTTNHINVHLADRDRGDRGRVDRGYRRVHGARRRRC